MPVDCTWLRRRGGATAPPWWGHCATAAWVDVALTREKLRDLTVVDARPRGPGVAGSGRRKRALAAGGGRPAAIE